MSQNRPKLQSINLGQYGGTVAATGRGLTGPTGSTDDTVLRFTAANTTVEGQGIVVADSAANATIVTITNPGLYLCTLSLNATEQGGATTSLIAITRDSTIVLADPTFAGGAFVLANCTLATTGGTQQMSNTLMGYTAVTSGQTALVRFQASNGSNAAPTNLSTTLATFSVRRVSMFD